MTLSGRRPDLRRGRGIRHSATSTSRSRPGRPSRWSVRWGRVRPRSCRCCRVCTTSPTGAVYDRRRRRPDRSTSSACATQIAVVTDDPFLFSATVHDNIAYARPDATREEVETRPERPRPTRSSATCPRATTRSIGERGLTLSGGQRQRIAIARAIVGRPADPDPRRRDLVGRRLDRAGDQARAARGDDRDRTTFVIAHRLSTIALADEIVVLEDGSDRRTGQPRRAARQLGAVPRDRREGNARSGVHDAQAARSTRWWACERAWTTSAAVCARRAVADASSAA